MKAVKSKKAVGNYWDILNAILGHKYHQNHPYRVIAREQSQDLQPKNDFYHICVFQYFSQSIDQLTSWPEDTQTERLSVSRCARHSVSIPVTHE